MIDVMFFLLATFIARVPHDAESPLAAREPAARKSGAYSDHAPVTLTVTQDGSLLVNEVPVTLDTLTLRLRP